MGWIEPTHQSFCSVLRSAAIREGVAAAAAAYAMGNAMDHGVLGAGGEEQQPAGPDPLIFWECRRCKPRMGPGNFRLSYTEAHERRHQQEDAKAKRAREEAARQRADTEDAAAIRRRSWMGRRKKY